MKILADEGVDRPTVEALCVSGFDVDYILETFQGANDRREVIKEKESTQIVFSPFDCYASQTSL